MSSAFGYAGRILDVDLSSGRIDTLPTADYAGDYLGGRGIAARLYWDNVPPGTGALDAANRVILMTGPLAGYPGIAASMCQMCGKAAATNPEQFSYSTFGGGWGAHLKFAGYDGVIIGGKSATPVYLLVEEGKASLRDAAALWGKDVHQARAVLKQELGKSARVLAIGPAGENLVSLATTTAEEDSSASGFGAVFGSKKFKAIVTRGEASRPPAADPAKLEALAAHLARVWPAGAGLGRGFLAHPDFTDRPQICFGCIRGCDRAVTESKDGATAKWFCQGGFYYMPQAQGFYGKRESTPLHAAMMAHGYGLDTQGLSTIMRWLSACHRAGLLTDTDVGLPLSRFGSREFIETLIKAISLRQGFGDVLARGLWQAADAVGPRARALITDYADKNGQGMVYGPRTYPVTSLFYGTEPRMSLDMLHEVMRPISRWKRWSKEGGAGLASERLKRIGREFWGTELALDYSTFEGKALAAKRIQDRMHAINCLVLCTYYYPLTNVILEGAHVTGPDIEAQLYAAVTGRVMDTAGFCRVGERIFNLARAIWLREGSIPSPRDRLPDFVHTVPLQGEMLNEACEVPGKDAAVFCRKGMVLGREDYERMLNEYYVLRGWDATGLPSAEVLGCLGLGDVARDLTARGLA